MGVSMGWVQVMWIDWTLWKNARVEGGAENNTCISHKADVLKVALRPITARQRVKLAADWLDKLWLAARSGTWVGRRPSQSLVKLSQCATFNKKLCMKMLWIATPVKSVLVLKFAIFVVGDDNRGKSVGLEQFCYFHSVGKIISNLGRAWKLSCLCIILAFAATHMDSEMLSNFHFLLGVCRTIHASADPPISCSSSMDLL